MFLFQCGSYETCGTTKVTECSREPGFTLPILLVLGSPLYSCCWFVVVVVVRDVLAVLVSVVSVVVVTVFIAACAFYDLLLLLLLYFCMKFDARLFRFFVDQPLDY